MIKNTIQYSLCWVFAFFCVHFTMAQTKDRPFPYYVPLTGTTQPSEIGEYLTSTSPTGSSRYTTQGLVLTEDDVDFAFSGFYLKDIEFPSNYGLIVEFEYAMVNGSKYLGRYGDGLSMFLFDGTKNFEIGAPGASLGYANRNSTSGNQPGVNGAYLGFGIDVFGSYKLRGNLAGERREGIAGITFLEEGNHITLRGGQYKNDRYKGYPVVFTEQALPSRPATSDVAKATLDYDTGDYITDSYSASVGIYDLRTSIDYYGEYQFNKVEVTLIPIDNGNEGMRVSLMLRNTYTSSYKNPIRNFVYPNRFKTRDENGNLYTFETEVPDIFKLGFAAGTGGATQTQIVRKVKVNLPYAPETVDKVLLLCLTDHDDKNSSTFIENPLKGDVFYSGTVENPISRNDNSTVDLNSFRFEDENGFDVGTQTKKEGTYTLKEYHIPGVGTWEFRFVGKGTASTSFISFEPDVNELPEGDYSIYFSAHSIDDGSNGPFSNHVYRSRPTKITVQARWCKSVVNPSLPIRVNLDEDED